MPVISGEHVITDNGSEVYVTGDLLAYVSGKGTRHRANHDVSGVMCNMCSWLEIKIFRLSKNDPRYVEGSDRTWLVWSCSMKDPERFHIIPRTFIDVTDAHYMVYEILAKSLDNTLGSVARKVLATAASFDDILADVYADKA